MNRFKTSDRDQAMTHTVSFHNVPMPRGLAFAINHIETHGAPVSVFSADRRDRVIAEHNREFGTLLKGQMWLLTAHARDPVHYAAANNPLRTSHCFYSDGNPVFKDLAGNQIPAGQSLDWFMCGIDLADRGQVEDVTGFLRVSRELGYHFVQPYSSGSERHHVNLLHSPIGVLEAANQISKKRK